MGNIKSIMVFISITIFALTIYTSCDSSTEPELEAGRRDYVWEVDTLPWQSGSQYRMWGNSPDNIWTVGSSLEHEYNIWHYDGNSWQPNSSPDMPNIFAIWGTDDGYVFVGSRNGEIWRKIGDSDWELFQKFIYEEDLSKRYIFSDINGYSKDDFFGVGTVFGATDNEHGFIVHYKNNKWSIKHLYDVNTIPRRIKKDKNNEFIIKGNMPSNINDRTVSLFEFDGNNLISIYHKIKTKTDWAMIQEVNGEVLYNIGYKVNERIMNSFYSFCNNDPNSLLSGYFNGNSKKDLFFGAIDGIMHFNGTDTQYLINIGENEIMYISGSVHFGNESFFLGENSTRNENYIFHCKLKE